MEIETIPAIYVKAIVTSLQLRGWDRETLLLKLGVSDEILDAEKARIARSSYLSFTGYLALKLQDESFGLLATPLKPGTFAMLCHSCINCDSLEHFLRRMIKHLALVNNDASFQLNRDAEYATLTLETNADRVYEKDVFVMLALAITHRLMSWAADCAFPLTEVNLCRQRPHYASDYNLLFNTNICFDQPHNQIRFSANNLERKIPRNDHDLRRFLQNAAITLMSKPASSNNLTSNVRNVLKGKATKGFPTLAEVSKTLGYAPTTLKRRLIAEGSTYQSIKNAVRRDSAIYHLAEGEMSIDDIALAAGFADPPSFFRAFKRWTGTSPRAYMR
ncbi:transcriptional regulator, AraC family [marine gamma proteobacterium HTCC2148]|jgi:AraC-like DNA-binding protein|nr:transcriptional regulator, AraC family [marine gamma proteobacterium HTCC2148]MBT6125556.1 AraC family transcriptional regulator [Halieaceae bacterium]MBT7717927.1 AraC family transcriptional regulator [Halieaceae bacterium]